MICSYVYIKFIGVADHVLASLVKSANHIFRIILRLAMKISTINLFCYFCQVILHFIILLWLFKSRTRDVLISSSPAQRARVSLPVNAYNIQ